MFLILNKRISHAYHFKELVISIGMSDDIISTTHFNLNEKSAISKIILVILILIAFSQMRDALYYSHIASEVISAPVIVVFTPFCFQASVAQPLGSNSYNSIAI